MASPAEQVTRLLAEAREGRAEAAAELLPLVYDQLRALAASYLRREHAAWTLQPTALVHDAYLRLVGEQGLPWADRSHFMAAAARAMRQILIENARRRDAEKRGGGWQRVTLTESESGPGGRQGLEVDVIALSQALDKLADLSERQARLVELRWFAGLTIAEAAEVLGVAESTADADWYVARAWLARELGAGSGK